jgi:hypothetical protein
MSGTCDSDLLKNASGLQDKDMPYKDRGSRCEGVYKRLVATSEPLSVRSFTTRSQIANSLPPALQLTWARMGLGPLTIRGFALKQHVYYEMDTRVPSDNRKFDWTTDVLTRISLAPGQVGVVASFVRDKKNVVLPIAIAPASVTPPLAGECNQKTYQVTLWPERDFREVYFSIQGKASSGPGAVVLPKKELGKGLYPAGRAISFCFSVPAGDDVYDLVISAEMTGGGGVPIVLPFLRAD